MRNNNARGVTLLELTLAIAIFAITMGVAAQGLVSFYTSLDMQRQRVVAVNQCRSIISEMRTIRDANPNSPDNPNNFQTHILEAYEDGREGPGPVELRESILSVTYEDSSPTANPIVPTIRLQWLGLHGHVITQQVTSAITER